MVLTLLHDKVRLALHEIQPGEKRTLLLLHGLGEAAPKTVLPELEGWSGSIHALDFTGHGDSTVPAGGGYTPELLAADADSALAHLGPATVLGRGLGAWVALLLAGSRPALVRGAILCDGPGLAGGGPEFADAGLPLEVARGPAPPDPAALVELAADVRPPGYATLLLRQARHLSGLEMPVTVCAGQRPPWLAAVASAQHTGEGTLEEALRRYGGS